MHGVTISDPLFDAGQDVDNILYDPFDESPIDEPAQGPSSEEQSLSSAPPHSPDTLATASRQDEPSTGDSPSPMPTQHPDQVSTFSQAKSIPLSQTPTRPSSRKTPDGKLAHFLSHGCGCKRKCYEYFFEEHYREVRDYCISLT